MINVLGLEVHSEREALANMLDAMSIAENSARQMAIYSDQPQWILVAEKFNGLRQLCSLMGQSSVKQKFRL